MKWNDPINPQHWFDKERVFPPRPLSTLWKAHNLRCSNRLAGSEVNV